MKKHKLLPLSSVEKYCEYYFENYNQNNNHRDAWLAIREKRYKEIVDNCFYLENGAETFKNEVLKFWEGDDYADGYSYGNSKIRKRGGGWVPFQDNNGQTVNGSEIIRELEADNLELHGNYSWSMMFMGGDITVDMQKLRNTLDYLFDESIAIEERFFEVVNKNGKYKIKGMSHGKASAFLHIKYPDKYGVWNSCTEKAFKILNEVDSSEVDSRFKIKGADNGEKYKKINEQLKWLFETYKKKDKNNNYGFENLSDVDIFVWYISNNFLS